MPSITSVDRRRQGAAGGSELLLIDDRVRVFVRIARVERPLILARPAIEERAKRGGDDPSEVEDAGARIFEEGRPPESLCTQGW